MSDHSYDSEFKIGNFLTKMKRETGIPQVCRGIIVGAKNNLIIFSRKSRLPNVDLNSDYCFGEISINKLFDKAYQKIKSQN